jgi:hypothetical protein
MGRYLRDLLNSEVGGSVGDAVIMALNNADPKVRASRTRLGGGPAGPPYAGLHAIRALNYPNQLRYQLVQ